MATYVNYGDISVPTVQDVIDGINTLTNVHDISSNYTEEQRQEVINELAEEYVRDKEILEVWFDHLEEITGNVDYEPGGADYEPGYLQEVIVTAHELGLDQVDYLDYTQKLRDRLAEKYPDGTEVPEGTDGSEGSDGLLGYPVEEGDTLGEIADKFGVPLEDLLAANPGIDDPDSIYPDDIINIPRSAVVPAPEGASDVLPEEGHSLLNSDPLVLDLDGDGVETLSQVAGVQFDLNCDGFAETTGWISPDDGFLVLDRNGDGLVNDGSELFGDMSTLGSNDFAENGFEALADHDENLDGVIDINDSIFADLRVWRDLDSNGICDAGEIQSLPELNVKSLSLSYETPQIVDSNNNELGQVGTWVDGDNVSHELGDIWFSIDPTRTTPIEYIVITDEVMALPDANGYGVVRSLRESIMLDDSGELQLIVEQFVSESDYSVRQDLFTQLITTWVNVNVPHEFSGYVSNETISETQYRNLIAFIGVEKSFTTTDSADLLFERYEQLSDLIFYQLSSQTYLKDYFNLVDFSYDESTGGWTVDVELAITVMGVQAMLDSTWDSSIMNDFLRAVERKKGDRFIYCRILLIVIDTLHATNCSHRYTRLSPPRYPARSQPSGCIFRRG